MRSKNSFEMFIPGQNGPTRLPLGGQHLGKRSYQMECRLRQKTSKTDSLSAPHQTLGSEMLGRRLSRQMFSSALRGRQFCRRSKRLEIHQRSLSLPGGTEHFCTNFMVMQKARSSLTLIVRSRNYCIERMPKTGGHISITIVGPIYSTYSNQKSHPARKAKVCPNR